MKCQGLSKNAASHQHIHGTVCSLRRIHPDDVRWYAKERNDPEIAKNMIFLELPDTFEKAQHDFQTLLTQNESAVCEHFIIEVNGTRAGMIGLSDIIDGHKARLGYWIAKNFRRQGLATTAVTLVVEHAFTAHGIRRVYGFTRMFNVPSQKVLEKCDFVREGLLRHHSRKGNTYFDDYLYARIRG